MTSHGTETGSTNRPATESSPARIALVRYAVAFLVLVFMLTSPTFAAADSTDAGGHNEIYVEYSVGESYFGNEDLTAKGLPGPNLKGRVNPDLGFNVGGAIGMRIHKFIRTELQLGYRQSEVGDISLQGEAGKARGQYSLLTAMANTYIDYDLGIGIIPYAGAGIGWGLSRLDAHNANDILDVDGEDAVFVWSLMVGGTVPVNDVIDVALGYRYIATTNPKFFADVVTTGTAGGPVASARLHAEFDSHETFVAIRYKF